MCQPQEAQVQQVESSANNNTENNNNIDLNTDQKTSITTQTTQTKEGPPNAKDVELLTRKTRKLQLEVDEKNEIISVLKDELETTKEQNDKFQRENIQLLKDSKRVEFLQDENDFLQDKVGSVANLELEIKRLKEKLAETEFLKLRIGELEEDKTRALEESSKYEEKWKRAEESLTRVSELESELNKWKTFSHELENEKSSIQTKLLESIEQETSLNSVNKQVEDEVLRLRSLIKSYEEQREPNSDITDTSIADTSIKFELDKEFEKELSDENRNLKQKLSNQEGELDKLLKANKEILNELESNKKLIFDLRQDFACEKSLALKLTKQLATFTKQIKSLDKQYFPMHETSLVTHDTKSKKLCLEVTTSDQNGNKTDTVTDTSPVQSSRQLNALIDTNSDQRLMLSMLHQNNNGILQPLNQKVVQPQQRGAYAPMILPSSVDNAELNEQQIAHLANLHHQHYYHHLRHMHQFHKLHHQHYLHLHHHRLHHKYQQQQQASSGADVSSNQVRVSGQTICSQHEDILSSQSSMQCNQNEPIYTGGSQFYAPSAEEFDQVYANMTSSNTINQLSEHSHRTRLVNSNNSISNKQQPSPDHMSVGLRSSPNRVNARISPHKANHHHQQTAQSVLPQIDEVNGLPTVDIGMSRSQTRSQNSSRKEQSPIPTTAGVEAISKSQNSSSNQSPQSSSSSSPTSSASSNLSPSSASSSSSLNLLSASSTPFNRSALRSTTSNLNRRQFSIERDLIEALPKTATLTRVGSCRATSSTRPTTEAQIISCIDRQLQCGVQMRTPVKCQQPSMRTSKILSISQQSGAQLPAQQLPQQHHHQQREQSTNHLNGRKVILEKDRSDKLTGNLANIRLSDSLAFSSLRAPKSSSGVGSINRNSLLNNSNIINGQQTSTPSAKILSASATNTPDKRRQSNAATTNVNGDNKSAVWFEYGCV